ncbi:MAG: alpha/beta hydrolase, partial [Burkholderiales bacterium]
HNYIRQSYPKLPLILAGFSFGTAIASGLARQVEHSKLILIGPAVTRYLVYVPEVKKTIVIHGEKDEVIAIEAVFKWSRETNQPIIWLPHAGHFFHGKLLELQNIVGSFV